MEEKKFLRVIKYRPNPKIGEMETVHEERPIDTKNNPYFPFKDKEAMARAKEAGYPDKDGWQKRLLEMNRRKR